MTHDMRRVDLVDKARVLSEINVCAERYLVDGHLALDLLTVAADKIVRLF
jgi:hypothetical protein